MRLIWNVALKDEDGTCGVEINPWEKQKVSKPKPRKAYWTEEQLLSFVNYADNNFYYTFGSLDEVHKSVKNLMLSYSKKKFLCLLGLIIFKFHEA